MCQMCVLHGKIETYKTSFRLNSRVHWLALISDGENVAGFVFAKMGNPVCTWYVSFAFQYSDFSIQFNM